MLGFKFFRSSLLGRAAFGRNFAITRAQKNKHPHPAVTDFPPASTLAPMRDMFNLFDAGLLSTFPSTSTAQGLAMPLDIKETDKTFNVAIDVPGVEKKDINISISDNQLLISAERSGMQKEENENFRRVERYYGHVSRALNLPRSADESKIDAEYKDGVLHITIPKLEGEKEDNKKIEVK